MSTQLVNRSPDLKRLRDEGYDIVVRSGFLIVANVPYVKSSLEVANGTLVCPLRLAGERTDKPDNHTVQFVGEFPYHADGSRMENINAGSADQKLDCDLIVNHTFSTKPKSGSYDDYYHKMKRYSDLLSFQAQAIDSAATSMIFPAIPADHDDGPFHYSDTASSRAGTTAVSRKLGLSKVVIIGLGGTGSYVLDLVAKTPVKEIHIYDGDKFSQHNAFRSPGAPSLLELAQKPAKVTHFKATYSKMHRGITPHDYFIDDTNIDELKGADFVFVCADRGPVKRMVAESLETFGIPFIDVGMGVSVVAAHEALRGQIRLTTSTNAMRKHVWESERIPFNDPPGDNDYIQNIQIADLNALNAALAVIRWKKLFGFYLDSEQEHHCTYSVTSNKLMNDDRL